jgi:hypothetical protein
MRVIGWRRTHLDTRNASVMLAPAGRSAPETTSSHARLSSWSSAIARALGWTGTPAVGLVLAMLTVAGCLIRAAGLPEAPGTLARDESRLALAAQSILVNHIPTSPGGAIYTRGLLPGYVEAAAFATLGVSDQVARLPSLVVGTLIVPATYWLARGVGREWPAAAAAAIVAFSSPLIMLAREAWLYPWLTLWLILAAGWLVRAHRGSRSGAYALAAVAYTAAAFSHELAALFLPAVALFHLTRLKAGASWSVARSFWLVASIMTIAVLALTFVLRSPTAAGGGSEFQSYLQAATDVRGLTTTLHLIALSHPWLVPASAVGLGVVLFRRRWRVLIWLPIFVVLIQLIFNGFVLTRRGHPRDIQVLIPFLAVTAMYAAYHVAPMLSCTLLGWRFTKQRWRLLSLVFGLALVLANVDVGRVVSAARPTNSSPTWLQAMAAYTPRDVVLSYAPTKTTHYLGRTDFWVRPNGYSRYVWSGPPPFRDIYTGAVVVRNARDLETLVIAPNQGRTLWVLAQQDLPPEQRSGLTEILTRLAPLTIEEPRTGDETRVLRVRL